MTDILEYLAARPYPGRGIMLGRALTGGLFCAYFIMGRSENSRNRVFERTEDGIRTRAYDESRVTDPSLIIYTPVRSAGGTFIVTNGDQTDTIHDALLHGDSVFTALAGRSFEPDAPNWTPRISGLSYENGDCLLSILKTPDGERCERCYYAYSPRPGEAKFISTYAGAGTPRPSFEGEPVSFIIPGETARACAEAVWAALDKANRVALYVRMGAEDVIINSNAGGAK